MGAGPRTQGGRRGRSSGSHAAAVGSTGERLGVRSGARRRVSRAGGGDEGWWGAHSEAHRSLQRCARPGLAADVVEGKQQVVVLGHTGWKTQLELLVELWGPGRGVCWGRGPLALPTPSCKSAPGAAWPHGLLSASGSPAGSPGHSLLPSGCPTVSLPLPGPPARVLAVVDHGGEGLSGELTAAGLAKDDLGEAAREGPTGDPPRHPPPTLAQPLTGRAWLGSSPAMYCTRTVRLRTEPWRLLKLRQCGYTYSRFLRGQGGIRGTGGAGLLA